jgi:hypothetical protein
MEDEEYAIVSKKEFLALKKEIEKIRKNPLEGSPVGENLQDSIDNLNGSLNSMLEVFKQAAQEMNLEEHDTQLVSKQIGPIQEKIETLIEQNQKIAKGIVAIADMVKEKLEEIDEKTTKLEREMNEKLSAVPEKKPTFELPPLTGGPAPSGPKPQMGGPLPPPPGMPPAMGAPGGMGGMPPMGFPGSMQMPEEPMMGGMGGQMGGMGGQETTPLPPPGLEGGIPPMPAMPQMGPMPAAGARRTPIMGGLLRR